MKNCYHSYSTKLMLTIFVVLLISVSKLLAQSVSSLTVSTNTDEVNGNTTSIATLIVTPGGTGISLREAIIAANNEPAGTNITINIPAGTYVLSITGIDENNAATGDLDIKATTAAGNKTIHLTGADSGTTTITTAAGWNDRILDLEPLSQPGTLTVNISGIKFTGGNVLSSFPSGGAILAGYATNATTISNCVFTGNTAAANGGAIAQSSGGTIHHLSITNSTFTNNTATNAVGGAVSYIGQGNVMITGCTFTNNTCGTQGGAINISGNGTGAAACDISKNNFINNNANGTTFGGAVVGMVNVQSININFNRIIGNNAANVATGKLFATGGGVVGLMNLQNNWWGTNNGPNVSTDIAGSAPSEWLQLKATASPSTICNASTSIVTASFLSNNLSSAINPTNLSAIVGVPVLFVNPVLGTLMNVQTAIQPSGTATATFTSGNIPGSGGVNAVVDNVPGSDAIANAFLQISTFPEAPVIVASQPLTICRGDSVILSASLSNYTSFAANVINFSSEYSSTSWSANQALGIPDTYPTYGDIPLSWAPLLQDGGREFIELGYANPASINFIDIYETYSPGTVDTVYVKNPFTDLWEIVYTAIAAPALPTARKLHITFPLTSFPVSAIRIAMNTAAVPDWNEIDAVSIGRENNASNFASFIWSTGATAQNITVKSSGTFSVSGIVSGGCTSSASSSANVIVNPLPTSSISSASSLTFCSGDSVLLQGTIANNRTYQWRRGNGNITGQTASSFIAKSSGTYRVMITNTITGCSKISSPKIVTVNTLPPIASITGNTPVCRGSSILLSNSTQGGTWSSLDKNVATVNNAGLVTGNLVGTAKITYTSPPNANGCSNNASVTVTVKGLPSISSTISGAKTACVGKFSQLNNTTTGGTWSTVNSGIAIVSSTGLVTGIAIGTVTITYTTAPNSSGCTNRASTSFSVTAPCLFKADFAKNSTQNEESLSGMEVSIFPNPTANLFNLKVKSPIKERISIRVLDVNGKTAFVSNCKPGQTLIFGEQLISGTYLVEVRQGNEVKTIKAVKVKM